MKILINKTNEFICDIIPKEFKDLYCKNDCPYYNKYLDRKDPRLIKWLEEHPKQQHHAIWVEEIPKGTKYRIITTESGCEDIEYFDDIEWEIAD